MAKPKVGLLDRMIGGISPAWALDRHRARQRLQAVRGARAEYDGASFGRRTANWRRSGRDPNAELSPAVMLALRGVAEDLVRNNPFAERGVAGIAHNLVGPGITFQVYRNGEVDQKLTTLAKAHFETTACDAEGRHNLYGLQVQAARSIVTRGASLARRRWRRAKDGLPVPFQIQLLEPDYINMQLSAPLPNNAYRLQGIEFNGIGQRTGYWLYARHPGSILPSSLESTLIPAVDVAHVFRATRPESLHGATWFAPVIARLKDFGDYEDAQLIRQKIASCFTVFKIGDPEDDDPADIDSNGNPIEVEGNLSAVEPGIIETLPPGVDVKFADPPGVDGYDTYAKVSLRAIAAGLGTPYEVLTGDLTGVNFSSGRMGWLEFQRSITSWQWTFLIPQLCEPIGQWFLDACQVQGIDVTGASFQWTPPRREMIDPATEVPANRDAVRAGQKSWSQMIRENGDDPEMVAAEMAKDFERFDTLGLVLDCDPRKVTQVGNATMLSSSPAAAEQNSARKAA